MGWEGISGIAAKEGASFLINDETSDNRIKPYLSRSYLKSSMVIPINLGKKLLGVINLGALRTSPVNFNQANVLSINKLIDLAALAITPGI